jgi:hypothetical protein
MPWTIGLMLISLIITFIIGNLLGALMVWENTPQAVEGGDPVGHGLHRDPAAAVGAAPDVLLLQPAGVVSADRRLF